MEAVCWASRLVSYPASTLSLTRHPLRHLEVVDALCLLVNACCETSALRLGAKIVKSPAWGEGHARLGIRAPRLSLRPHHPHLPSPPLPTRPVSVALGHTHAGTNQRWHSCTITPGGRHGHSCLVRHPLLHYRNRLNLSDGPMHRRISTARDRARFKTGV
jgi:hypothetical protein